MKTSVVITSGDTPISVMRGRGDAEPVQDFEMLANRTQTMSMEPGERLVLNVLGTPISDVEVAEKEEAKAGPDIFSDRDMRRTG